MLPKGEGLLKSRFYAIELQILKKCRSLFHRQAPVILSWLQIGPEIESCETLHGDDPFMLYYIILYCTFHIEVVIAVETWSST
mmetsp:Transcript_11795/g.18908  ORF Transcript_11795/g.18908 Transcript_11795/m.18908 type:complete len:83 (+) Transcript_11795:397-645(+)